MEESIQLNFRVQSLELSAECSGKDNSEAYKVGRLSTQYKFKWSSGHSKLNPRSGYHLWDLPL